MVSPSHVHRVILLGVRDDLVGITPRMLKPQPEVNVASVISSMPSLRSGSLSKRNDSSSAWRDCLKSQAESRWVNAGARKSGGPELSDLVRRSLRTIEIPVADRGGEYVRGDATPQYASQWYCDSRLGRSLQPRQSWSYGL